MYVYRKNVRKSILTGILPPIFLIVFVLMIAVSWPSLKQVIIDRVEQMNNPIYKAILGDLGIEGLGLTWQAAAFLYTGGMMNILLLFISLLPIRTLYSEIDKKGLDVILSYPIPRWKYLLEKYAGFLTYALLYPISIITVVITSSVFLNEDINVTLVINYSIGIYLIIFALGSISLLVLTIFLDSNKSMAVAGVVVVGMYLLESLGGMIQVLDNIQFLSIFHYFKINTLLETNSLPILDVVVVALTGLIALACSLLIFDRREFAN